MMKNIKNNTLKMVETHIVDTSGSMKLILYDDYIHKVKENETYFFTNVRVKKDKLTQEIFLNSARNKETAITPCLPFKESLFIPKEVMKDLGDKTLQGEIIGVEKVINYYSCVKCSKKVENKASFLYCQKCNIKLKKTACQKMWLCYVLILSSGDHEKLQLTLFNNIVEQILTQQNIGCPSKITEEELT